MAEELPTEGQIVEFADKARFHLGLVIHVEEKSGKVRMINAQGKDITLPPKQILHTLPIRLATNQSLSGIQNSLKSLDEQAESLVSSCDIESLWSLVIDSDSEIELDDLVGLSFDNPQAQQKLAMIRALRNDKVYFKALQTEIFSPRPESVVEDLKKQIAAKAQKEAWRLQFAQEAAKLLAMVPDAREIAIEEGFFDQSPVPDAWKIVEQYAIYGSEYDNKSEAESLLECVQQRINRGFSGTAFLRARSFLRESGYWSPDTPVALLKYNIPTVFSDEIEKQSLGIYQNPVHTEDSRRDLTHLEIFSIDDTDTLDIDDALSFEKLPDGSLQIGVHIAAPACSIPFDSPLETEARHRATSIYLPEMRIPMLPTILSENALSLMPDQVRNAISFCLTFDPDFNLVDSQIFPSIVRSKHRLSYDSAEDLLEHGDDALSDEIRSIQEITEFSATQRRSHGAIDIDLPEYKLEYDRQEKIYHFKRIDSAMMSRQLVAECMILANNAAAEFCHTHEIPALYRLQPSPVNMPRQDTLDAMPNDLMRAYAMRRCMQPASNSMTPAPHAGLGLDKYIQATSPLRRYVDLLAHYQFEHWFRFQSPRFDAQTFNALLAETDLGLSNAKSASAEALHTATLAYLKQILKTPVQAIIVQYSADRGDLAQVILVDTQIRSSVSTRNRWPLGTLCYVSIEHVNPEEGSLLLQFIDIISP